MDTNQKNLSAFEFLETVQAVEEQLGGDARARELSEAIGNASLFRGFKKI